MKEFYPKKTDQKGQAEEGRFQIEGRNEVREALRAGRPIDRLYIEEHYTDELLRNLIAEAKKKDIVISYLPKEKLDVLSETRHHQGVIARAAAFAYASLEDLFAKAAKAGEDPFFILLDSIEDPHNLGAIIRTAEVAGAHGVILPKRRSASLTATVMRASAGALNYLPVVRVTNLTETIGALKKRGLWFICADMGGTPMTALQLTGPIGLVIGGEGKGVSRLVRESCDFAAQIPMKGKVESLNASVAAGVLIYEIVRQRGIPQSK